MKIFFNNTNESLELIIVHTYRATFFAYDQSSFGPKFVFWKEIMTHM